MKHSYLPVLSMLAISACFSSGEDLIISESFILQSDGGSYVTGPLEGQGSPDDRGFSTTWEGQVFEGKIEVVGDGLTYADAEGSALETAGGSVLNEKGAGVFRTFDAASSEGFADYSLFGSIGLRPDTTLYFSFLIQHKAFTGASTEFGDPIATLELRSSNTAVLQFLVVPNRAIELTGSDQYLIRAQQNWDLAEGIADSVADETHLVVYKVEFLNGTDNDRVSVFVDPILAGEGENEPDIVYEVSDYAFTSMRIGRFNGLASNPIQFDELRFGKTWESVTPHSGGQNGPETLWSDDNYPPASNGYKLTGLGWLEDASYPFLNLATAADFRWLYLLPQSQLDSIYAYDYVLGSWVWTSQFYGTWYYSFATMQWAKWGA